MPQSDPRFFTSSSRKHDFRGSHGLPPQSDISESSNYTKRSLSTTGKMFPSTKAFQSSVRGAARTFIMWLVPACGKSGKEATLHDRNIPENDVSSTSSSRGNGLEIAQRLEIAIDVCHAITYLHAYSGNLLSHSQMKKALETLRAKVADFGFARLAAEDPDATHISTQIKGTAGYVDPEYIQTYQLTEKSDVYSFGVLLVELITGRRPIERHRDLKDRSTTRWVLPLTQALQKFKEGDTVLAMDPRMRRNPSAIMAVEKMMALGRQCLASTRKARPSMKQCGEILWRIRRDYREMHMPQPSPSPSPSPSPRQLSQASTSIK